MLIKLVVTIVFFGVFAAAQTIFPPFAFTGEFVKIYNPSIPNSISPDLYVGSQKSSRSCSHEREYLVCQIPESSFYGLQSVRLFHNLEGIGRSETINIYRRDFSSSAMTNQLPTSIGNIPGIQKSKLRPYNFVIIKEGASPLLSYANFSSAKKLMSQYLIKYLAGYKFDNFKFLNKLYNDPKFYFYSRVDNRYIYLTEAEKDMILRQLKIENGWPSQLIPIPVNSSGLAAKFKIILDTNHMKNKMIESGNSEGISNETKKNIDEKMSQNDLRNVTSFYPSGIRFDSNPSLARNAPPICYTNAYSVPANILNDGKAIVPLNIDPITEPHTGSLLSLGDFAELSKFDNNERNIFSAQVNNVINYKQSLTTGNQLVNIYILDTFDGESDSFSFDVSHTIKLNGHGEWIYKTIKKYSGLNSNNIYSIKTCDSVGKCSAINTLRAICDIATYKKSDEKAVINLSMGTPFSSKLLRDVMLYAVSKGITFITAYGNIDAGLICGPVGIIQATLDSCNQYPADWSNEFQFSIFTAGGLSWDRSDYSKLSGDGLSRTPTKYKLGSIANIYAPGIYIPDHEDENIGYPRLGTSYAAPYITAAIANIFTRTNCSVSIADISTGKLIDKTQTFEANVIDFEKVRNFKCT